MELRHLRYFTAVAEELHFGRAAERLHMAQPPLSQHILNLEREIGVTLFARTKRKVELTDAGRVFLTEARLILAHAEQAIHMAQRASRGEIGRLVIGFVLSATCSLLPETLRVFRERFPAVEMVLEETTTGSGLASLAAGRMHMCFVRLPINGLDASFASEPVLKEKIILALPSDHRLAAEAPVSLRQLSDEPFIIFPRVQGAGFYDHLVSLCRRAGFSPRVAQEAGQMQTILSLVAAGLGVALIPSTVQSLRREGVIYRPLRERAPETGIAMIWPRADASPMLENFALTVRQVAREQSSNGRLARWTSRVEYEN
jgi:DNA-binding transcriptional LysR family regulator